MKNVLVFCLIVIVSALVLGCREITSVFDGTREDMPSFTDPIASPIEGYELIWSDEFDGNSLDTTRWKYRVGVRHSSSQRPENVFVDDGKLHISLKRENHEGKSLTGGGAITKHTNSYGYYEVRAKLDGGYGWHESFWTAGRAGFDSPPITTAETGMLEIDVFEHYWDHNLTTFSYGAIEWSRFSGGFNRATHTTTNSLVDEFNVYGFEYTPDYLNYYFNGDLLETVDMRDDPEHDFFLWLSGIATKEDAVDSGLVSFDYIRAFEISAQDYAIRKAPFISLLDDRMDSLRGATSSLGVDYWVEGEDFAIVGAWKKHRDVGRIKYLQGFNSWVSGRDSSLRTAKTAINIDSAGTYHLWVRSKSHHVNPTARNFKAIVNHTESSTLFGTHGYDGFDWEYGGSFSLTAGLNTIKIFDRSQYFARFDKLLLTTDVSFLPDGAGAETNVTHTDIW